jgi:SMI1 / KNR4 family (SUKH-1)
MELRLLLGGGYEWDGNPPAADDALAALVAWSPASLPAEYLELLRLSDGGHATRSDYPTYVRIWPARTAVEYNRDYEVQRWVPGLIGFGDDGGPAIVGFDTRSDPPYPVLAVPFVPMEFESAQRVAADFGQFIRQLVRRESGAEPHR